MERTLKITNRFKEELSNHFITQQLKFPCQHCGRKMFIVAFRDSTICDWCGHKIFKTRKEWFNYNLTEAIKKGNKNGE